MTCPSCRSKTIRRRKRAGLLLYLASLTGRWPYRCESCGLEFLLKKRYVRESTELQPEKLSKS